MILFIYLAFGITITIGLEIFYRVKLKTRFIENIFGVVTFTILWLPMAIVISAIEFSIKKEKIKIKKRLA